MSNLKHDLVQYLKEFVVDERRVLFEEKIQQITKHITVVLENIFQGRRMTYVVIHRKTQTVGLALAMIRILTNNHYPN